MSKEAAPTKVQAKEACVIVVGARPPVYETRIVRNHRTGKLAEVEMNPEMPPIDEGSQGTTYAFRQNEVVWSNHPAVLDAPGLFIPAAVD